MRGAENQRNPQLQRLGIRLTGRAGNLRCRYDRPVAQSPESEASARLLLRLWARAQPVFTPGLCVGGLAAAGGVLLHGLPRAAQRLGLSYEGVFRQAAMLRAAIAIQHGLHQSIVNGLRQKRLSKRGYTLLTFMRMGAKTNA